MHVILVKQVGHVELDAGFLEEARAFKAVTHSGIYDGARVYRLIIYQGGEACTRVLGVHIAIPGAAGVVQAKAAHPLGGIRQLLAGSGIECRGALAQVIKQFNTAYVTTMAPRQSGA